MYASTAIDNDNVLLGELYSPANIDEDILEHVDPQCLRSAIVTNDFQEIFNAKLLNPSIKDNKAWQATMEDVFLTPFNGFD